MRILDTQIQLDARALLDGVFGTRRRVSERVQV
jgi:hypothetical protein